MTVTIYNGDKVFHIFTDVDPDGVTAQGNLVVMKGTIGTQTHVVKYVLATGASWTHLQVTL